MNSQGSKTTTLFVAAIITANNFWIIGNGTCDAFLTPRPSLPLGTIITGTTTPPTAGTELYSSSSDADLLRDLPFVPSEVMSKFMAAVGDPLTASSLQAGYQAGVVSEDELEEIRTKIPSMDVTTELPRVQSVQTIEAHWKAAYEGQSLAVRAMCKLASPTIVPLVAKMQQKSVEQAGAMKWINERALPQIRANPTVVGLLADGDGGDGSDNDLLVFNNTRARYETDRGVWSASMDVFVPSAVSTSPTGDAENGSTDKESLSEAGAALAALKEGLGGDDDDDQLSSVTIDVLDNSAPTTDGVSTASTGNNKIGLVNAYFVPDDEIKILVVEIDGILHNVTWKGLN